MRTFIIMLALIANVASFAQQDTATAWSVYEPDTTFDSMAMNKCLETWDNVKGYMSKEDIERYAYNIVAKYDDNATIVIMSLFTDEDNGSVTDTSDYGHGFGNIHKSFMYKEYMTEAKKMPGFEPFKFEELDKPENIRFTLLVLNWQFSPLNKTKFKNDAERWMAWNVGFSGLTDPERKKRRETYWACFQQYFDIHSELVQMGYAQFF